MGYLSSQRFFFPSYFLSDFSLDFIGVFEWILKEGCQTHFLLRANYALAFGLEGHQFLKDLIRLKFTNYLAGLSGHPVTSWATQDRPVGHDFDTPVLKELISECGF